MKIIPLSKGYEAIIDDEDYERVTERSWSVKIVSETKQYAQRTQRIGPRSEGKCISIPLHRFIMNAKLGEYIDHINGNGLDNRKKNLRICTNQENARNQSGHSKQRRAKYKGVKRVATKNERWLARITFEGKQIHLGCFETQEEAAKAYNDAAIKYYGEFAWLNILS